MPRNSTYYGGAMVRKRQGAMPDAGAATDGKDWKGQTEPVVYSTTDAVFAVDLRQRIVSWSQGLQELLGHAPEEVIGRPCYEVIRGCDDNGLRKCTPSCQVLRQATLGRIPRTRLMRLPTRWGEEVFALVTHLLLGESGDRQGSILHVVSNVSEETRAAEFLKDLGGAMNVNLSPARREALSMLLLEPLSLTRREREVLLLLMRGSTSQEIADSLVVSVTTVNNHIQSILGKLACHTRREAVCMAFRECLSRAL